MPIDRAPIPARSVPARPPIYLHMEDSGQPLGEIWTELKSQTANGNIPEVGWDVARTVNLSAILQWLS